MRTIDCLAQAKASAHFQLVINEFIDEFRHGDRQGRIAMVEDPIVTSGPDTSRYGRVKVSILVVEM